MPSFVLDPPLSNDKGDVYAGDASARAKDVVYLGVLAEAGPKRRLMLDLSGEQVVSIIGKRGTGKSYSLGVLLEGLASGVGKTELADVQTERAALVLDIMDIFWTSCIPLGTSKLEELQKQFSRLEGSGLNPRKLNIDVWVPSGYGLPGIHAATFNEFRMQAWQFDLDDWASLFNVDIFSDPRGMLLADAVRKISSTGFDRPDGTHVAPISEYTFVDLLGCIENDAQIGLQFSPETVRAVRQRLLSYSALPIFSGSPTHLRQVLKPGRVSVLLLARVPDELKKVATAVLLKRLMRERRDASFARKRLDLDQDITPDEKRLLEASIATAAPRSWVLLDEAHVLASATEASVSREALVKFAKEGRNYGLSLAVATQQPTALDSRLLSQAETVITHQLTSNSDLLVAVQNLRSPAPTSVAIDGNVYDLQTLIRQLAPGVALFSCANAPRLRRACVVAIRPRITAHGGYEA